MFLKCYVGAKNCCDYYKAFSAWGLRNFQGLQLSSASSLAVFLNAGNQRMPSQKLLDPTAVVQEPWSEELKEKWSTLTNIAEPLSLL